MRALVLLAILLCACGERARPRPEPAPPAPPAPRTQPETPIPEVPSEPHTEAELAPLVAALDDDSDIAQVGLSAATVTTPSSGARCAVEPGHGVVLWPKPGAASTTFVGDSVLAAIHVAEPTRDELVLLSLTQRARPIVRVPLSSSTSVLGVRPPAIADLGEGRAGVGSVDRGGKLLYVETHAGRAERRELATDADSRFAPAIALFGAKRLIAYVKRGSPLRVSLLTLDPALRVVRTLDITPDAGGAASPFFAPSATGPMLVLVDPREGFSPIERIPIDADGNPGRAVVLRPVTGLLDPPRVVASATRDDLHIAYIAHGSSLASAVGYVRAAHGSPDPVSLVRPTGFGALWVDTVPLPTQNLVVFAATAPLAREATAPRAVHVRIATASGLGEATTFTVPEGFVYPALAAHPDGTVTLTASTMTEVSSLRLRCTP